MEGHPVPEKMSRGTEALLEALRYRKPGPRGTEGGCEATLYRVRASDVRTGPDDALRHRKRRHEQKLKMHELETGAGDEAQEWRCGAEAEDKAQKTETRHKPETRGIIRKRSMPNGYVGAPGFHFCYTESTRVAEHQENM